ncbi:MAG TPA: LON peptidase substrate-binding domain-containing protein [Anaerolineaceae bacterium]|nr:LON peptidase substrate-binding domain-containing protein [Anaerolineaceae bacterium]
MRELPLFPLHTVLFPGMPLELHIFESRYREMIQSCLDGSQLFGVVLIRQGDEALGPLPQPHRIGCTARIVRFHPLADGRMNILTVGLDRFQILDIHLDKPYLIGQVEFLPMEKPHSMELLIQSRPTTGLIHQYIRQVIDNTRSYDLPHDPLTLAYLAASLLQIEPYEKQQLLESMDAVALTATIIRLLKREIRLNQYFGTQVENPTARMN